MSADAIFNVTNALAERLRAALVASTVPGTVFVGPLDDPDATDAALILFLYRMMPNATLRNRERRVLNDATPPELVLYRDSLPLDLYYLITVGKRPGARGEEPLLRALGSAMREIQNAPELTGPLVRHETVHVSLDPLSTDEISRVWNLFPAANYRTSVAYIASPVWIDPAAPAIDARPVVTDSLRSAPGGVRAQA